MNAGHAVFAHRGFGQAFADGNRENMGELAVIQHKQAGLRHVDDHLAATDRLGGNRQGIKVGRLGRYAAGQQEEQRKSNGHCAPWGD